MMTWYCPKCRVMVPNDKIGFVDHNEIATHADAGKKSCREVLVWPPEYKAAYDAYTLAARKYGFG